MFNTRNILIAVGAVIALILIVYFVKRAGKPKNTIQLKTPDGEVEVDLGTMQPEPEEEGAKVVDLNSVRMDVPLSATVSESGFPLTKGSTGEKVRRFQNYLQSENRRNQMGMFDFGTEKNGANSYWGNQTDQLAWHMGFRDGITEKQYKELRINQYAKP